MKNNQFRSSFQKKLPVAFFSEEGMAVCLELLSLVYGESEITPVPLDLARTEAEDYLSRKYRTQVEPLLLAVEGEIIFPVSGLFDSEMFILDYRRFYSKD